MKSYSVQSVLDWLSTKGLLSRRQQAEAFLLTRRNIESLPITIHVLLGIGAFIGSICVVGFLIATKIISYENEVSLLVAGIVSIILALLLYFSMRHQRPLLQSFALQCALMLMIAGKVLFVIGFAKLSKYGIISLQKEWFYSIALLIVTVPIYIIFPLKVDRFISSLALILSILFNTLTLYATNQYFFAYYLLLIISTWFLFTWRKKSLHWTPFTYASTLGLCACAFYLASPFSSHLQNEVVNIFYFNIPLGLALLMLCLSLGSSKYYFMQLSTLAAGIGIVILTLISTPGIILSLGLLVLSYAKHERALFVLASIFLCLFLIHFYYSLPHTLEYKAAILVASGTALLASRMIMKQMKWDSEE
ncbi:MAG: DUF4401 domain-containing protein [Gammaproteobacteria bacterium]|jgi:hypothetical protein|nr:DUF4401 domain-containing protein [Gammaproteobacteria bacterium]